jgi:hypothetical protein
MESPKSFHARSDDETRNSILLVEDLAGYADFCYEHTVITRENAFSMVRILACLHPPFTVPKVLAELRLLFVTWQAQWKGLVETHGMKESCANGFLAAKEGIP